MEKRLKQTFTQGIKLSLGLIVIVNLIERYIFDLHLSKSSMVLQIIALVAIGILTPVHLSHRD